MNGSMERPNWLSNDSIAGGEVSWKNAPMNSISFLFLAAAILVLMFLVMAIFERLVKPSRAESGVAPGNPEEQYRVNSAKKVHNSVSLSSASTGFELFVVMPGETAPTHLAKPAPLLPCTREGFHCPTRRGDHASDSNLFSMLLLM